MNVLLIAVIVLLALAGLVLGYLRGRREKEEN